MTRGLLLARSERNLCGEDQDVGIQKSSVTFMHFLETAQGWSWEARLYLLFRFGQFFTDEALSGKGFF